MNNRKNWIMNQHQQTMIKNAKIQSAKLHLANSLYSNLPLKLIITLLGIKILSKYFVSETKDHKFFVKRRVLLIFSFRVSKNYNIKHSAYDRLVEIAQIEDYLILNSL